MNNKAVVVRVVPAMSIIYAQQQCDDRKKMFQELAEASLKLSVILYSFNLYSSKILLINVFPYCVGDNPVI
jgi:hypothetical protein